MGRCGGGGGGGGGGAAVESRKWAGLLGRAAFLQLLVQTLLEFFFGRSNVTVKKTPTVCPRVLVYVRRTDCSAHACAERARAVHERVHARVCRNKSGRVENVPQKNLVSKLPGFFTTAVQLWFGLQRSAV